MRSIVAANRAIWVFNVLLAAGTFAFAFFFILKRPEEAPLPEPPTVTPPAQPRQPPRTGRSAALVEAAKRINPAPPPVPEEAAPGELAPLDSLVTLIGLLARSDPRAGTAILQYTQGARGGPGAGQITVKAGKDVPGIDDCTLLGVWSDRALFLYGGQKVILRKGSASAGPVAAETTAPTGPARPFARNEPPPPAAAGQPTPTFEDPTRNFTTERDRNNPFLWHVDRRELEWAQEHQDELIRQVNVRPLPGPDGTIEGFKIDAIRPGSIIGRRGLQKGDIILSVNGQPLNSQEAADRMASDPAMRSASSYDVVLRRAGRQITLIYKVK